MVSQIRKVTYPVRDKDGKFIRNAEGFETAKELNVCPECATLNYNVETVGKKVLD